MTQTHLTKKRFADFPLSDCILKGLQEAGFEYCTPIQAETLPLSLAGKDIAGQAQTGTGKTAAFVLAALNWMEQLPADENRRPNQPRTLIIAPTRELAVQIHKDAAVLAAHCGYRLGVVFGGTGYEQQRQMLADGVDILIGTPGRLIDYLKQRIYDLHAIQCLVLDEADRMFDLGFIKDIRFLMRRCPPPGDRLSMLFSATLSYRVTELAYEHMNNPQKVVIEAEQVTADRVRQVAYMTANSDKIPLLLGLLRDIKPPRTIIFVNTKRAADLVWGYLEGNGHGAAVLSGDVPQKKRLRLLQDFQSGKLPILVATDVAARGLHIPGVTHVINFDLPEEAEDYVHRIGRTARAGAEGDAISFACETYAFSLPDIEEYIEARIPIAPIKTEMLAEVDPSSRVRPKRKPRDERGGPRGGKHGERRGRKPDGDKPKSGADGDKPKRRRRRRRKPSDGNGQPPQQ